MAVLIFPSCTPEDYLKTTVPGQGLASERSTLKMFLPTTPFSLQWQNPTHFPFRNSFTKPWNHTYLHGPQYLETEFSNLFWFHVLSGTFYGVFGWSSPREGNPTAPPISPTITSSWLVNLLCKKVGFLTLANINDWPIAGGTISYVGFSILNEKTHSWVSYYSTNSQKEQKKKKSENARQTFL